MGNRFPQIYYYDGNWSSSSSKAASPTNDGDPVMIMRVLVDTPKDWSNNNHGTSEIETLEFDCKGNRVRIKDDVVFNTNMAKDWGGSDNGMTNEDHSWHSIEEGNEDSLLFTLACPHQTLTQVNHWEGLQ
jgi:hypothetical protein